MLLLQHPLPVCCSNPPLLPALKPACFCLPSTGVPCGMQGCRGHKMTNVHKSSVPPDATLLAADGVRARGVALLVLRPPVAWSALGSPHSPPASSCTPGDPRPSDRTSLSPHTLLLKGRGCGGSHQGFSSGVLWSLSLGAGLLGLPGTRGLGAGSLAAGTQGPGWLSW